MSIAARSYATILKASPREAFGGGVKRISATIYEEVRYALKDRLKTTRYPDHAKPSLLQLWYTFITDTALPSTGLMRPSVPVVRCTRFGPNIGL
ncbi:hypothetical protein KCU71_g14087, partial [Aureobasidium melanogenum]